MKAMTVVVTTSFREEPGVFTSKQDSDELFQLLRFPQTDRIVDRIVDDIAMTKNDSTTQVRFFKK